MTIGQRIRLARIQRGLSIDDLADKLGKNRTTVYRYENGEIENLPLGILDSLADALDTTPAYLMGWSDRLYVRNKKFDLGYMDRWYQEVGHKVFTGDEHAKLMEYAKFLITLRNE